VSGLHEFIRRNVGAVLTPELALGISWQVDTILSEQYGKAHQVAQQETREAEQRRLSVDGASNADYPPPGQFQEYLFTREPMSVLRDLRNLHEEHFEVTERPRSPTANLNPDYHHYEHLGGANRMFLFVVRTKSGEAVGNFILRVGRSAIDSELVAEEQAVFLTKDHRKGMLAVAFMRWALEQLKRWGVARVLLAVKEVNDVSVIYRRLGFSPIAHIYSKEL
jgi:GNAT superfamily N-acetyltransferase